MLRKGQGVTKADIPSGISHGSTLSEGRRQHCDRNDEDDSLLADVGQAGKCVTEEGEQH